jgi:hypothetical protein
MNFKILVIQPQDVWHWNFDMAFIRAMSNFGDIIFLAKTGYLTEINVKTRINLPDKYFDGSSKFICRLNGIKIITNCKKIQRTVKPDITIFLSYDTISMLLWRSKSIICEHNNISNTRTNFLKRYAYSLLSKKLISVSLQNHISRFIVDSCKRDSFVIHHPVTNIKFDTNDLIQINPDRITMFFPSGSNNECNNIVVKDFLLKNKQYFAYLKGSVEEDTYSYKVSKFFQNYHELIKTSDFVVITGQYDYRVSGVAYEVLSFGRPIIIRSSLFSEELKRQYPSLVHVIENISEITSIRINKKMMECDFKVFKENTSDASIVNSIREIINHITR